MLRACDPRQRTDVNLPGDDDAPAETRPTFTYRYLTVAEYFERLDRFGEYDAATDFRTMSAKLSEALAVGLTGWRNVTDPAGEPVAFAGKAEDLPRVLGMPEMMDLYRRSMDAVTLGVDAKKNSASSPSSAPASSAGSAAPPADAR